MNSLLLACALAGCLLPAAPALGRQEPTTAAQDEEEETVRIETELIQTGVMVFDKQGRFVEGLRPDDFELTVEGKPAPLSFFERVGGAPPSTSTPSAAPRGDAKGPGPGAAGGARTVIFFADDLHLSFESRKRARDLIRHFIDTELADEDMAAVVSSSGRLGFLQQLTDNPAVLREAAARLGDDGNRAAGDRLEPPMSEYEALLIDHYDQQVTNEFAAAILALGIAIRMEDAVDQARSRARTVLQMAALVSGNTYRALEQAIRRSAQMPGRKIILLISDGFLLDTTNGDSSRRLRRITDAAARANSVVYTFDARGLEAGMPTSRSPNAFRVQAGERSEMQNPLSSIAGETGGRFVKNTNDMRPGVSQALAEASRYYLLAWRPDPEARGKNKFRRIDVKVKGRPELVVRLQNGYLEEEPKPSPQEAAKASKGGAKDLKAAAAAPDPSEQQLRAALGSLAPKTGLPTTLSANYLEAEGGPLLVASLRIEGSAVGFTRDGGLMNGDVEVVGAVYDSKGRAGATFRRRLSLSAPASRFEGGETPNVYYDYQTKLAPGLYQMRVATRDAKTGRMGSAAQWVEVPDLTSRKLALSSLLVAEARADTAGRLTESAGAAKGETPPEPAVAGLSVDRRFERTSALRYVVFIYNAAGQTPDVTLQTQIFRGGRAVMEAPPARVSAEGQEPARLAYAAEVSLAGLPPGRYSLRVTVNDRASKAAAVQRLSFVVK